MFRNDYSEIGAPEVLQALCNFQKQQNVGYGLDVHSFNAKKLICDCFGLHSEKTAVHFLAGGTQVNAVVISYFLRPYEAVIACDTGHINVHETGAVEGTGHKVVTMQNIDGKLTAEAVEKAVTLHTDEHMVMPKMVYISNTTETGTLYTKAELMALRKVCDRHNLLLFVDGARLGVALTAENCDYNAEFIPQIADVFYVGGTKNGALFGEAVVIKNADTCADFRYHIKNRGAMLAKGFALGIQFETLFTDGLYFALAQNANKTAKLVREGLQKQGISLVGGSTTNQIFVEVSADEAKQLMQQFGLELWTDLGAKKVVRIVTSFATTCNDVSQLLDGFATICH